jgi:hypothetical protein
VTFGIYIGSLTSASQSQASSATSTANQDINSSLLSATIITNSTNTRHGFQTNPHKRSPSAAGRNGILTPIQRLSGSTLLLGINIGLHWINWNYHVPVDLVALDGHIFKISAEPFELWHLGFNMMSFSSLGQDLEPTYGSIPFFLSTLSLIPLTTIFLLVLHYLHRDRNRD